MTMARTLADKIQQLPAVRRKKVEARAAELIAEELSLRDLRKAMNRTQMDVAKALKVGQDTVSRYEQRSDMLLSTLQGYVHAMGGELDLVVDFPQSQTGQAEVVGRLRGLIASRRVESMDDNAAHRLCVAPMMDWTDRHCRCFHRLLAPHARLYTEMVHAQARSCTATASGCWVSIAREHPVALQLGGSEPGALAQAARASAPTCGYDEINLNVGCPCDRVQSGRFGACLMREPALVADCVAAMHDAVATSRSR